MCLISLLRLLTHAPGSVLRPSVTPCLLVRRPLMRSCKEVADSSLHYRVKLTTVSPEQLRAERADFDARHELISSPTRSNELRVPPSLQWVLGAHFPKLKRPGLQAE